MVFVTGALAIKMVLVISGVWTAVIAHRYAPEITTSIIPLAISTTILHQIGFFKLLLDTHPLIVCKRIFNLYFFMHALICLITLGITVDCLIYEIIAKNVFIPTDLLSSFIYDHVFFDLTKELTLKNASIEYGLPINSAHPTINSVITIFNSLLTVFIPFRFIGFWTYLIQYIAWGIHSIFKF